MGYHVLYLCICNTGIIMFIKSCLWKVTDIYWLWPSDTIWWHRSKSALAKIMACCLVEPSHYLSQCWLFTPQPSGLEGYCRHGPGGRAGGRAGGCQTCGTHISVTAWWIFSIRSSVELSRPVVVHCHVHLPICPIWACPWAKNLSNLAQIGSRLCGTHISETVGWIDPI